MCIEEIVAAVSIPRQQLRNESAQKSGIQQQCQLPLSSILRERLQPPSRRGDVLNI
jgi:hypothetical protein